MNLNLLQTAHDILVSGETDARRVERLRQQLYADGNIDRTKADFLVQLHLRIRHQSPEFECLFYQVIKDHLLACERLGAEEADWLRRVLFVDGAFTNVERNLLRELKSEAQKKCSPDFEVLFMQGTSREQERFTAAENRHA
jgi:hypothetical protein